MLLGFSSCHGGEAGYAAASMKSHRASTGIVGQFEFMSFEEFNNDEHFIYVQFQT